MYNSSLSALAVLIYLYDMVGGQGMVVEEVPPSCPGESTCLDEKAL